MRVSNGKLEEKEKVIRGGTSEILCFLSSDDHLLRYLSNPFFPERLFATVDRMSHQQELACHGDQGLFLVLSPRDQLAIKGRQEVGSVSSGGEGGQVEQPARQGLPVLADVLGRMETGAGLSFPWIQPDQGRQFLSVGVGGRSAPAATGRGR